MPYEYKFFIILVNKFRLFYSFFCFICNYFTLIIFFYFTTSSSYNLPQKSTKMKFKIFNNSQRSNQLTDHQIKINELNQDNLSLSEVVKKSSARLCELEDQTYNSNKQLAEKIEEVEMAEERLSLLKAEINNLKASNECSVSIIKDLENRVSLFEAEKHNLNEIIDRLVSDLSKEKSDHLATKDKLQETTKSFNELNKKFLQQKVSLLIWLRIHK